MIREICIFLRPMAAILVSGFVSDGRVAALRGSNETPTANTSLKAQKKKPNHTPDKSAQINTELYHLYKQRGTVNKTPSQSDH